MMWQFAFTLLATMVAGPVVAATLRVPQDHRTIQAAISASQSGDTVLVATGVYHEHILMKPGIIVRSAGDNTRGINGLKRAEATIIDGGSVSGVDPGVMMAGDSTLDGFTITNVGVFSESVWNKHYDSQGEELGDDEGSVQAEGTAPAVSIQGVNCTVTHCIVHDNGDVGIGILGRENTATTPLISSNVVYRNMGGGIGVAEQAEPIIRDNTCKSNLRAGIGCRNANPIIANNSCFQNIRAGIGCREGAKPLMRGNRCYQNRRAGIGIRMKGTAPVVENNECYENEMAGIGCRDGASPILRNNICSKNKMAGIGVDQKSIAIIQRNKCIDNNLVAIGVIGESSATITGNELNRTGGMPPMIAIKDRSTATIRDNRITGGGVAAILIQGRATVIGNTFTGRGAKQGNAVWVWENSRAVISDNSFHGYQTAVNATKATVTITGNSVNQFREPAFVVKDSPSPPHMYGNITVSPVSETKQE